MSVAATGTGGGGGGEGAGAVQAKEGYCFPVMPKSRLQVRASFRGGVKPRTLVTRPLARLMQRGESLRPADPHARDAPSERPAGGGA